MLLEKITVFIPESQNCHSYSPVGLASSSKLRITPMALPSEHRVGRSLFSMHMVPVQRRLLYIAGLQLQAFKTAAWSSVGTLRRGKTQ